MTHKVLKCLIIKNDGKTTEQYLAKKESYLLPRMAAENKSVTIWEVELTHDEYKLFF